MPSTCIWCGEEFSAKHHCEDLNDIVIKPPPNETDTKKGMLARKLAMADTSAGWHLKELVDFCGMTRKSVTVQLARWKKSGYVRQGTYTLDHEKAGQIRRGYWYMTADVAIRLGITFV